MGGLHKRWASHAREDAAAKEEEEAEEGKHK
jgi:hypothetical protein